MSGLQQRSHSLCRMPSRPHSTQCCAASILHAVQVQIAIYDITCLCCSTSQDLGTLSYSGVYIPMEHLTSMLYMVAALSSKGKSGLQQNGYGINALDAESFVS